MKLYRSASLRQFFAERMKEIASTGKIIEILRIAAFVK